ncbi:MAG: efflux RND transporter periplasmic adaptor subunit [Gammaproteobacteria bacterium]
MPAIPQSFPPDGVVSLRTLSLAVVAGMAFGLTACDGGDVVVPPPMQVGVAKAERSDVQLEIEMVGTTLGTQDVPIRARVEGFLETMDFSEGTFVKKGDLLYTIDALPFEAKLAEAESQLAAAKTNLVKAQADLSRIRPLAEMNAVSEQDLDSAVAQEEAAQAGVRASDAAVDLAKINLSYTRIIAPIEGLIGLTKAKPGEFVGREPNPVVLNTLSDINPIRVRFSIAEREYLILARTYLQDGLADDRDTRRNAKERNSRRSSDDLTLILADGVEHPYKGHPVASAQSIDLETGTYTVEASFPNPNKLLLPGQFARIRAPYQKLEDAVVVPRMAVSELQGRFRVYVVTEEGTVALQEVTLGPIKGNYQVVEKGLNGGETVVVEGLQKIKPGMPVATSTVTIPASAGAS